MVVHKNVSLILIFPLITLLEKWLLKKSVLEAYQENWYLLNCMTDGLIVISCQEPAQEISPMTRSCRRDLISKASGLEGSPGSARAATPKPESVCLTILCLSATRLTLAGGYPRPPFSGENQLRALANVSWAWKEYFNSNPLLAF